MSEKRTAAEIHHHQKQLQRDNEEWVKQLQLPILTTLDQSRPKNLTHGVTSGLGNIVRGQVGGAAVAVLFPTAGLIDGLQKGGLIGGLVGVTKGTVRGVVGGSALAIGGVATGVMQVGRGIVATPESIIAPHKGKWWNKYESQWVLTNLPKEKVLLDGVPDDDSDILSKIEEEIENRCRKGNIKQVDDTSYYDVLDVPPSADADFIQQRYFVMARQCHPHAVGPDDKEAAEKFKAVSEAYQVLGDPVIREEYDKKGMDGLSSDRLSVVVERHDAARIEAKILCMVLFGSEKFNDSIGRLSMATSASVGDSSKFSLDDARTIQKRRVTRLALKLADKIHPWVIEQNLLVSTTTDKVQAIEQEWRQEALELCKESYGHQLVPTIGKIYNIVGIMHEGSNEIGNWAVREQVKNEKKRMREKCQSDGLEAILDMNTLQIDLQKRLSQAKTSQERQAINKEMHDQIVAITLRIMWESIVIDISCTIQEATKMVFFDRSVNRETRKLRAAAVKRLGEIWMNCSHGGEHEGLSEGVI